MIQTYIPWAPPRKILDTPYREGILGIVLASVSVHSKLPQVEVMALASPDMVRFILALEHPVIREFFERGHQHTGTALIWPPKPDNYANFAKLSGQKTPVFLMKDPLVVEGEVWASDEVLWVGEKRVRLLSLREALLVFPS